MSVNETLYKVLRAVVLFLHSNKFYLKKKCNLIIIFANSCKFEMLVYMFNHHHNHDDHNIPAPEASQWGWVKVAPHQVKIVLSGWTGLGLGEALWKDREEWRKVIAGSVLMPKRLFRLRDEWVREWVSEMLRLELHRTCGLSVADKCSACKGAHWVDRPFVFFTSWFSMRDFKHCMNL